MMSEINKNSIPCVEHQLKNGTVKKDLTYTIDDAIDNIGYGLYQRRLVIFSGLAWTADACEIVILSVIGQILACDWHIYRWQNALLTSSVFIGMMFGSPILGAIADKYGRKKSVIASLVLMLVFGAVSAASPSYYWLLVFRACTGFALGGVPQLMTLTCELCPVNMRGKVGFYLCYFWGIGTVGIVLLSWVVMINTENWRLLLVVTALPSFIALISIKWFPESVRYYLVTDQLDRATDLLEKVASANSKQLPEGRLAPLETHCENRGRICDLLNAQHRRSTLLFWYIWLATAFCYYSIVLISPDIVQHGRITRQSQENATFENFFQDLTTIQSCEPLSGKDYVDLVWTSAAELPGLIIYTFLIEMLDRRKLMFGSCVICSVLVLLLLLNTQRYITLIILFTVRGVMLVVFQMALLMTSEAFPTTLRAIAMGAGSAFCRIGGLICPYVSQILVVSYPITAICILSVVILFAGIAAVCLPLETRGMILQENPNEKRRTSRMMELQAA